MSGAELRTNLDMAGFKDNKETAMEEDVEKQRTGAEWPDDKPFPLTPMEAY